MSRPGRAKGASGNSRMVVIRADELASRRHPRLCRSCRHPDIDGLFRVRSSPARQSPGSALPGLANGTRGSPGLTGIEPSGRHSSGAASGQVGFHPHSSAGPCPRPRTSPAAIKFRSAISSSHLAARVEAGGQGMPPLPWTPTAPSRPERRRARRHRRWVRRPHPGNNVPGCRPCR